MSGPSQSGGERIADKRQLVEYLEAGCKPAERWRIGTEHEKFAYTIDDLRPLPYDGPRSIRALLEGFRQFGWQLVEENGKPIAARQGDASITLEPGGQLELSGAPLANLHQTCDEVYTHLHQVKKIAGPLGIALMGLGFNPKWRREDVPWMPKGRYRIMRDYMPRRGGLGLDMMLRTCTVQVNLDYSSESDMVRKFRVSMALQPVATALFANSPFVEGKPSGFLSYRSHIWEDTDPDRTGVLDFVFDSAMGFERYVDYALGVPMYFVYRDGRYIDASGQSFRDFIAGKLPALPGERPTMGDWSDHLTTLFPEVRLKQFLEMRGADSGPWKRICALSALWVGLLYDETALSGAENLIRDWTLGDHHALRTMVPRLALGARFRGRTLDEVAVDVTNLAIGGLNRRRRLGASGDDESVFLQELAEIAKSGKTPAERILDAFGAQWRGSVDPVFREQAY